MTRDTVDLDLVVDRSIRLGRVAVGTSCPGRAARLPPLGQGLEDLPGPFPLVIAPFDNVPLIIALKMAAVRRPSGDGFADLPRTLLGPEARVIAPCGFRQLSIAPSSDDAQPLVVGRDLVYLDAD